MIWMSPVKHGMLLELEARIVPSTTAAWHVEDLKKLHKAETEIKSNLKQLGADRRATFLAPAHAFTKVQCYYPYCRWCVQVV